MNYKLLFRDAGLTLFTQILTALSGVLIMILISRGFGLDSYGEYYIVKRSSDVIWLFFLMGMTISIPRNKAFVDKANNTGVVEFTFIIFPLISAFLFLLFSDQLMTLFLKDLKYELGTIVSMLILGMIFYAIISSYLRAISKFIILNIGTFVNFTIIPLTPLLFTQDLITYLKWYSILILFFNVLIYIIIAVLLCKSHQPFRKIKTNLMGLWDLLKYGVLRLPGLFLASLIFTFPVILLNYIGSSGEVGSLGQVFQLFSIVSMPVNALGIILLPNFSKVISEGNRDSLQLFLRKGKNFTLMASTVIAVILAVFIEGFLYIINGEYIEIENLLYLRVFIFTIIPFSLYNFLRNPIDAAHKVPYSTILVVISFIISIFISLVLNKIFLISNFNLIIIFTSVNLLSLGLSSYFYTKKLYFR